MTTHRTLPVDDGGRISGLRVIAFHGSISPASTPAQREAILVDARHRLTDVTRIAPRALGSGFEAHVDSVEPPLPEEGALPGIATRVGPYPALTDGVVCAVGESERRLVRRIGLDELDDGTRVGRFLAYVGGEEPDPALCCEELPGPLWVWYATKMERHKLWKRLNPAVRDELRAAVGADHAPSIRAAAWWLLRVVVDPIDVFFAAEALRRAGSPDWRPMLEERLRTRDESVIQRGLADAAYSFDKLPGPGLRRAVPRRNRIRVRSDVTNPRQRATAA